ncbi:MAG: phosphotransferase [Actinomycetota bacterium]
MHADEVSIDEGLVVELLRVQMPDLAVLPINKVEPWGTDNAIYRLGDQFVVRLPRIGHAVKQVELEWRWLPELAPVVGVPVPEPVAVGRPGAGYPFDWAVHRWVPGELAVLERMADPVAFAVELAEVIRRLAEMDPTGAPPAHNRARPLAVYDEPTRRAIEAASHLIDGSAATRIWEDALAAEPFAGSGRWVHGDLEGNCLLLDGRLGGLVDWGSACAGDPAVDVQVVWSPLFTSESRTAFLDALDVDAATIARAKGAAINQACAALPYYFETYPLIVERSRHKLAELGVHPLEPSED